MSSTEHGRMRSPSKHIRPRRLDVEYIGLPKTVMILQCLKENGPSTKKICCLHYTTSRSMGAVGVACYIVVPVKARTQRTK